jgi:EAL domain-containing protein (putative c-di-GMP-specific phosphodiesterase class I)/GGDEF domain-containing protein
VFLDANNTLRYGMSNVYASSNQNAIQPLNTVIEDRAPLIDILKNNRPFYQLDTTDGAHTFYLPGITPSGIHYLTIAVTEPISLQKISQTATFDTITKSLILFMGILPFLIVYRNVLSSKMERLGDAIESTTEKLHQTNEILHERVEEKTKELINEGFIDPITHLPNRHRLIFDLDRNNYRALVIIHLKNLQELNHFFGTSITDSLRQQMGLLLTKLGLNVFRLGRDEFALLLEDNDTTKDIMTFSNFLLHTLNDHPFNILNEKIVVSTQLGIDTSTHLSLSHADEALANAKELSQDVSIYQEDSELKKHQAQNISIASSIREAYYDGRIICFYQPIISTKAGKLHSYETLSRLISKDGEIVLPLSFLTIAKRTALYPEISREIIRQACEAFADRNENFSVHVCAYDMMDSHTLHYIKETIVSTNTSRRIIFELSEEDIYHHYLPVSLFITSMKQLGAKISIDNFGADYSSFEKFIHLDIDYIKIDGKLVNKINQSPKYLEAIRAIATFTKGIGALSVAENVENDDVFTTLQTLDIDYVQGFHIGSPTHLP